jgi:hypothetical protein
MDIKTGKKTHCKWNPSITVQNHHKWAQQKKSFQDMEWCLLVLHMAGRKWGVTTLCLDGNHSNEQKKDTPPKAK